MLLCYKGEACFHLIPLLVDLFLAQVTAKTGFQHGGSHRWLWVTAKEMLLQGLCVINTLSYSQQ